MNNEQEREFGDFVAARTPAQCRFAYLLCGDWYRAEDVVQTAFTKLYLAWNRVRDRQSVDAYVRKIIVNVLLTEGRRAWYRRERLLGAVPEHADRHDLATRAGDQLAVLAALRRLPARQRAVVVLRYWEDLPIEQVATMLGCSDGTVKSQAAKGLSALREALGAVAPV